MYEEFDGTARAIDFITPIENVMPISSGITRSEANKILGSHDYTAAPVIDNTETIVGTYTVTSPAKSGTVADFMEPLSPRNMVTADAQFSDVLLALSREHLLMVLDRNRIAGIVTPSDIWTAPARVYLYSLLANLEIKLADYLRGLDLTADDIDLRLGENRVITRQGIKQDLISNNLFIDDVATLSLVDLIDVAKVEASFTAALAESQTGISQLRHGLVNLRNDVMHPSRPLKGVDADGLAGAVQQKVSRLKLLITVCERAAMHVQSEPTTANNVRSPKK